MKHFTINGTPQPPVEPPEEQPACTCRMCGGDIWQGEDIGLGLLDEIFCIDCIRELWNGLTPQEQIMAVGCVPGRAYVRRRRRA